MTLLRGLRAVPFLAFGAASIWWAARAPQGRKPFTIAFDFSLDALLLALTKWPHMASMAFLFLLALIATGLQRSVLAAALVFGVGVGWELAQSTVVGHNARIADLLPNAAALTACVLVTWVGQMLHGRMAGARSLSPPPARASMSSGKLSSLIQLRSVREVLPSLALIRSIRHGRRAFAASKKTRLRGERCNR